ncbi:MAG: hypothetical protein ACK5LC_11135, partial [Coprobacillaceae bacterium]
MNRKWKKILAIPLSLLMVFSLVGCQGDEVDDIEQVASTELTEEIKAKYNKSENYTYAEAQNDLPRDHAFEFEMNPDAYAKFKEFTDNWADIIGVYKDSSLTQQVAYKADNDENSITISPYRNPVYALTDVDLGGTLYDQGEWNDWGYANQYYLVKYYDLETGEALEKPEITVFTIETEIKETPNISLYISEEGLGGLKWDKVKGADEYAVLLIEEYKDGSSAGRYVQTLATTKETKWEDFSTEDGKNNWNLRTNFGKSADELYQDYKTKIETGEMTLEEYSQMQFDGETDYSKEKNYYFAVVAMNEKGSSKVSNFVDKRMVASQIPVSVAYYMNDGGIRPAGTGDKTSAKVDRDVSLAPTHIWVIMGDGNVSQMLVNYNI